MANSKKTAVQKKDNKLTILLIIGFIIVAAFVALYFITSKSNEDKLAHNPYGKKNLEQSTIDILNDKNYQNIILPDELQKKISSGKPTMVYFFQSDCPHCKKITPILMPLAKDMGVHIDQFNLLEFKQGWDQYTIEGTPTLVYYKDGKEQLRVVGEQTADTFKKFFEATILKDQKS
ncbi:thioredoxin family protein [Rummeliibacillus pycnus]|uniref:thioredoxin family protein n=1 Tax=Rummeliibacillus pycnus TaxID=101070 RepID=UPI000C9C6F13|nr:thioredoxin family protein [Rummeliibacillus pycnus]